jgi:thiol-disulfide isomerase/thioredoxin
MRFIIGIIALLVLLAHEAGAVMPQRPSLRPNTYTIPAALESLLPISPPKPMPKTTFQDPSGAPVSFARFKGQRVMAFFWSGSCVPCLKTMPELNQMAEHYGGKAFELVTISVDSTGSQGAKALLDRQKWPRLKAYADPTRQLVTALGITQLPTTILIDTAGNATAVLFGPQSWDSPDFLGSLSNLPSPKAK